MDAGPIAVHPDAALLALCATSRVQAGEWQRLWAATKDTPEDSEEDLAFDTYCETVWPGFDLQGDRTRAEDDLVRRLATLPAHTPEGRQARAAAVYAIELAEHYTEDQRDDFSQMMLVVIREAAGDALFMLGEDA